MSHSTQVDLVAQDVEGRFILGMVEQGPWTEEKILGEMKRVQERLYDYVDLAVDGVIAKKYPQSVGVPVVIRLSAYELPRKTVEPFFWRFADAVRTTEPYKSAIENSSFIADLAFEFRNRGLADAESIDRGR